MSKSSNQKRRKGKEIARPVRPKKDQKVFSSFQFEALPNEIIYHVFSRSLVLYMNQWDSIAILIEISWGIY